MKNDVIVGKNIYHQPLLHVHYILIENCMAAGSTVNFEEGSNSPVIEDQVIDEQIYNHNF